MFGSSPKFSTWNDVDWGTARAKVRRIQYRIYEASRLSNSKMVHMLQKLLLNNFYAKLLAVQLVTTLHEGRNTAGVDKRILSSPNQKFELAERLQLDGKSQPIRRVFIDKPGKTKKRPLGIPTIEDRARQALAKLALEPEWEAKFEPSSYGFRPGRSAHDAMERILYGLRQQVPKWVFDANIRKCFNRINHDALIAKLDTFPAMKSQIRAWLKAGVMEGYANSPKDDFVETKQGTPQGGIISPLLANIALHGLEFHLKDFVARIPGPPFVGGANKISLKRGALIIVRYADDFVVIHRNKKILESCITEIKIWLDSMGLSISEKKSDFTDCRKGFSFLGFRVLLTKRKSNLYKVKMYPSRNSQARFLLRVRKIIITRKAISSYDLIQKLRPVILGWANYFRYCECSKVFSKLNHLIFQKVRAWVFRRDSRSGREAIRDKYFPKGKTYTFDGRTYKDNWVLTGKRKGKSGESKMNFLPHLNWVKKLKHVMVQNDVSFFDRKLARYWSARTEKYSFHVVLLHY